MKKPKFIEVCAGCGGLSTGFIKAGFKPVLLNEIDPVCCRTLKRNHDPDVVDNSDMRELSDTLKKYKGIDVLMGGVPCQSFSQAGLRKGLDDERGNLMMVFKGLLKKVRPKIFLIENVKGLVSHDKGKTLKYIIKRLSLKGIYNVTYEVVNAVNFHVPQKRERIFIVGVKRSFTNIPFEFPKKHNTVITLQKVLTSDIMNGEGAKYSEYKKGILDLVPSGGCWVDLPEDIKKEYMGNSINSGGGKRGIARRLSMNEPCLTLLTTPTQKQTERCHPTETRPLNVAEYSRIQTFPDDYIFEGTTAQKYKQIGNAVPVKLAYYMGRAVKKFWKKIHSASTGH